MTHDRRPLYVLLAGVVGLLSGPVLLGLVRREVLWLGLAEAPMRIDVVWSVIAALLVALVSMVVMGTALYPSEEKKGDRDDIHG